jgi:hypothetical protein
VGRFVAASLLTAFALYEGTRVVRRVAQLGVAVAAGTSLDRPVVGGFIFLTKSGANCWSFDDDEDVADDAALIERAAPTVEAVIGSGRG